jgi:hypothetical protein
MQEFQAVHEARDEAQNDIIDGQRSLLMINRELQIIKKDILMARDGV